MIIYEDNDFLVTCSGNEFDKFIIFLNSAAGLDRILLSGVKKARDKLPSVPNNIYTPFNINEINFLCKNANWYQRKTVKNCISAIKKIISGHEESTVIYGSSMGGFGAIHFGAELGVTSIAFSPQATLEEEFDIGANWKEISKYAKYYFNKFDSNITSGKCINSKIYMFYDGKSVLDKKHAMYIIKNCKNCISFNIPYSGHACTGAINKYYRIKNIVIEILNGEFDPEKFRKSFFSMYNIDSYKKNNGLEFFYYLCDIIKDNSFYVSLGVRNEISYKKLCSSVIHLVEKRWNSYIDEIILCMCNTYKIMCHAINIKSKLNKSVIENEYDRMMICALYYFNRKEYNKSIFICNILYRIYKYDKDLNILFVKNLYYAKNIDYAMYLIDDYISKKGRNYELLMYKGIINFDNKRYHESRKYLFQSLMIQESLKACIYYAKSLKDDNKLNKAVDFLFKYMDKFSYSGYFLAHLGVYLIMIGKCSEGKNIINDAKLKKGYPSWGDQWLNKADKYIKQFN